MPFLRWGDREGQVWDMCLRYLEMALEAIETDKVARERERSENTRHVDICALKLGLPVFKYPSPSQIT